MSEAQDKEIMRQDWLRLVDFGDKAIAYNAEQDQIINALKLCMQPGGKDNVTSVKRLHHLYDYRFFTMAPVYVTCGVPFDIMGEFRGMLEMDGNRYDGPRVTLEFSKPVFDGLDAWNYMLEGIYTGPTGYDKLVKFMTSQRIRQKDTGAYWTINHVEIMIADPMAVDRNEYDVNNIDTKTVVGVFLPSGTRYQLGLDKPTPYPPVKFKRYSPDQNVVQEGAKLLTV